MCAPSGVGLHKFVPKFCINLYLALAPLFNQPDPQPLPVGTGLGAREHSENQIYIFGGIEMVNRTSPAESGYS